MSKDLLLQIVGSSLFDVWTLYSLGHMVKKSLRYILVDLQRWQDVFQYISTWPSTRIVCIGTIERAEDNKHIPYKKTYST